VPERGLGFGKEISRLDSSYNCGADAYLHQRVLASALACISFQNPMSVGCFAPRRGAKQPTDRCFLIFANCVGGAKASSLSCFSLEPHIV